VNGRRSVGRRPSRSGKSGLGRRATEHCHAGLGLLTPAVLHYRDTDAVVANRQAVLTVAYAAHPERFILKPPPMPPAPADRRVDQRARSHDADVGGATVNAPGRCLQVLDTLRRALASSEALSYDARRELSP